MNAEPNRYSPPKADVAEQITVQREPMPPAVYVALTLLAVNLLFGLAGLVRSWDAVSTGEMSGLAYLGLLVSRALELTILIAVARRRNWGRYLLLVIVVLTVLSCASSYLALRSLSYGSIFLGDSLRLFYLALPVLLSLVATYLLFFPARGWFARPAR